MILSGEVPRVVNKWWHEEPFILGNLVFLCRVCGPLNSLFRALGVKFAPHIVYVYIPRTPSLYSEPTEYRGKVSYP